MCFTRNTDSKGRRYLIKCLISVTFAQLRNVTECGQYMLKIEFIENVCGTVQNMLQEWVKNKNDQRFYGVDSDISGIGLEHQTVSTNTSIYNIYKGETHNKTLLDGRSKNHNFWALRNIQNDMKNIGISAERVIIVCTDYIICM